MEHRVGNAPGVTLSPLLRWCQRHFCSTMWVYSSRWSLVIATLVVMFAARLLGCWCLLRYREYWVPFVSIVPNLFLLGSVDIVVTFDAKKFGVQCHSV